MIFQDLTGKKFGKLTAVEYIKAERKWRLICDCGNEKYARAADLKNGKYVSCGCWKGQNRRTEDLTGRRFGKLVVMRYASLHKHKRYWECLCDCGNVSYAPTAQLKNGQRKSCGCVTNKGRKFPNKKKVEPKTSPGRANRNRVVYLYKRNAQRKGLEFTLSDQELDELFGSDCFYCGKPPSSVKSDKHTNGAFTYNGIDRLDPSMGYTHENVVPCCSECNYRKHVSNFGDFIGWIDRASSHLINKGVLQRTWV